MPITDDVRKYGETVLDEARKPWYAAVGASELAYGQLTQLPTEVQTRIRKLQYGAGHPAALREAVEVATSQGLRAYGTYANQAKETYESLAHRGELVVRRLRRSPEVKQTFEAAQELVAEAGETVAAAEAAVTEPGPTTTSAPAAAQPAAAKPAAGKSGTGRKASAKRTPKN